MTDHSAEFRRCLVEIDVAGMRAIWHHVMPGMPQPETEEETLKSIHIARTLTKSIPLRLRFYSHRWLTERSLPSMLPDEMKPRAERMYPVVVETVGISVNSMSPLLSGICGDVQTAMENAVLDAQAEGRLSDSVFVKARMNEAASLTRRKLLGI